MTLDHHFAIALERIPNQKLVILVGIACVLYGAKLDYRGRGTISGGIAVAWAGFLLVLAGTGRSRCHFVGLQPQPIGSGCLFGAFQTIHDGFHIFFCGSCMRYDGLRWQFDCFGLHLGGSGEHQCG